LKKQKERLEKNLPAVIMQMNKAQENERAKKRMRLNLPQPQITDRELELLSKMGYVPETDENEQSEGYPSVHLPFIIIHYSLFIIHYSLFIIHYSLFIIHYSLFIIHYSSFIILNSHIIFCIHAHI
jgi:hypothetical protein